MTAIVAASTAGPTAVRTTSGAVEIGNLYAHIDGRSQEVAAGQASERSRAVLVDLMLLRGHLLGRIADQEWAGAFADRLAQGASAGCDAFLARARTRGVFHRFDEAWADLETAERRGADAVVLDAERASVLQGVGRRNEALTILRDAVERRADVQSLGDLATLHAELGDVAAAEHSFDQALSCYRGVSPVPVAQLDLRRARLWRSHGNLPRARAWLEDAVSRLPAYAPAQGLLGEVEAELGETGSAIARLRPLTASSDDPAHATRLARVLRQLGRPDEARAWHDRALARYDELAARHPQAFAAPTTALDHLIE